MDTHGNGWGSRTVNRGWTAIGGALLLWQGLTFLGAAYTITWTNTAGGDFHTPGNWDAQSPPGAGDIALFNLTDRPYTVTWSANSAIGAFKIDAGTVRWDLQGYTNTYARVDGSSIGTDTVAAHLTVTNGVVRNTTTGYSGALLFKMKGVGSTLRVESQARMEGAIYPQIAAGSELTLDGPGAHFSSLGYWSRHAGRLTVTNGASVDASSGFKNEGGCVQVTGDGAGGVISIVTFNATASMSIDCGATVRCDNRAILTIYGRLSLNDGRYYYYHPTINTSGYVSLEGAGAVLEGQGSFEFTSVTNRSGTVRPGGQGGTGELSIWREFTNGEAGRIEIELGGTKPGDFDRLRVPGPGVFHCGGTLVVSFVNGFRPARKDSFAILDFVSAVGTFDTLELPDGGKGWDTDDLYTVGVLRYRGLPGGTLLSIR